MDAAPVVVLGKVRSIFVDDSTAPKGYITHLIAIDVEKVEKAGPAEDAKAGKVLYALSPRYRPLPGVIPPMASYPNAEPARGDTVRVHCAVGKDGSCRVLMNQAAIKVVESPRKP